MSSQLSSTINSDQISAEAYRWIRDYIHQEAGIDIGLSRQMLVIARLRKRLASCKLNSFDEYIHLLADPVNTFERQAAIDLLSTNETYFFRESQHLDVLREKVLKTHPRKQPLRLWSAASSSGEEAYTIAMVLSEHYGYSFDWKIFGSDVSERVVKQAQTGLYPLQRIDAISEEYRKLCCLKGIGKYNGYFLIDNRLRDRCRFEVVNLVKPLPDLGQFEVIFFRNALIYFDDETKELIIRALLAKLSAGGLLFIGHSESLKRMDLPLETIAPAAYRKLESEA